MSEEVKLPALGESVTEGTVTRWLKAVGEHVDVDEPLLEVSTDKVDTEVPSPVAGIIQEILVAEDETAEVGAVLARIGDGQPSAAPTGQAPAETESAPPAPAEPAAAAPPAPRPEPITVSAAGAVPAPPAPPAAPQKPAAAPAQAAPSNPRYVTPIVRRLAGRLGVDLARVTGTGTGGRIRKEDVEAAAASATPVQAAASQAPGAAQAPAAASFQVSELRGTRTKMSRLRKVIAERAVNSMVSTAQLTTVVEVDVTRVAALRDRVKGEFLTKTGNKLSFLPFFVLAAVEALQTFPIVNATVDGDEIVYPAQENISMAVDTPRGLLTPVVKNAAGMNLSELSGQIADLAARTRDNKLTPDELAGGTFTITNTGSRGALFDTPVVFLPQSAILGTGAVMKRPAVVKTEDGSESIAIRSFVYLALSYDHRIIDGADAARFLSQVKARLEEGAFEANLGI